MAMTAGARVARPRWWPAGLVWALWMLTMLGMAAILWLRQLLVDAGRPELMTFDPLLVVAMVSAATTGAVVASRRPAHPVGWLLLAFTMLLVATGVAAAYGPYGYWPGPAPCPLPALWPCTIRRSPWRRWPASPSFYCSPRPGRCPLRAGAGGPGSAWPCRSPWFGW